MKGEPIGPGYDGEVDNELEYAPGHEKRKKRWSELERKSRKERRHPREQELDESPAPEIFPQ
jgi:hypothetical protein